ncbi:hypothetical protein B0T17DRAFT_570749 [Bombardia bombarda]|uniref:Lipid droplet-associated hydrolase n=1 Tax=Bombardia bombarda TaxID=252184 RepID=A0AA40CF07_9PEZI|nr:hypothetical protein B0T17DRAFT_570749 [Bombardia bombarda]
MTTETRKRTQSGVPYVELPSPNNRHDEKRRQRQVLLVFVPGNPGLVHYYDTFLGTLRMLLDETETKMGGTGVAFTIYAQNLLGFEDGDDHGGVPFGGEGRGPYGLEEQIEGVYGRLAELNLVGGGRFYDEVVVMGHSVGAYIAVEVFHRHHHFLREGRSSEGGDDKEVSRVNLNLKAGILLFPAVSHLARSSNGRKLDVVRTTPLLDSHAHRVAKAFVDLWPRWLLGVVVRRVMGFTAAAAEVTVGFLRSRDGIWQALHLGKDELVTITEERWSREIGGGDVAVVPDKFFFYFGEKDHWVADECRDEFIARRKEHSRGRVRIEIDREGIPHAFCIHHGEKVAEKVKVWVDEIVGSGV